VIGNAVSADWVGAIGQVVGAAIAALAAWLAYRTAKTAERVSEKSIAISERSVEISKEAAAATEQAVVATRNQTVMAAIQELSRDYAAPAFYAELRRFGRFVGNDEDRRARFANITRCFTQAGRRVDRTTALEDEDFKWVVAEIERDLELGAARRQIHHHFKRVWTLGKAGLLADPKHLRLLTSDNTGWYLWLDEVLPVTRALARKQESEGRVFATADRWPDELIAWVEAATKEDALCTPAPAASVEPPRETAVQPQSPPTA
jgi:hypothetical protein